MEPEFVVITVNEFLCLDFFETHASFLLFTLLPSVFSPIYMYEDACASGP